MASHRAQPSDDVIEHFIHKHLKIEVKRPAKEGEPPRLNVRIDLHPKGEETCDKIEIASVLLCPWPACGG